MSSILSTSHAALRAPAAASDPTSQQGHDRAVLQALQALAAVNSGVLQLAASGSRTSEADQSWRVALLEDLAEGARDMSTLIAALVVAELGEISEDCAICTGACRELDGASCACLEGIG